jgi:hypothetical protein
MFMSTKNEGQSKGPHHGTSNYARRYILPVNGILKGKEILTKYVSDFPLFVLRRIRVMLTMYDYVEISSNRPASVKQIYGARKIDSNMYRSRCWLSILAPIETRPPPPLYQEPAHFSLQCIHSSLLLRLFRGLFQPHHFRICSTIIQFVQ